MLTKTVNLRRNSQYPHQADELSLLFIRSNGATPQSQVAKGFAEISEWESKKENKDTARQMDLMQNRIQLLQIEQEKKQTFNLNNHQYRYKRVQQTQKNADQAVLLREQYDLHIKMKEQYRQETLIALQELNFRTKEMNQKKKFEKEVLKQTSIELKKTEFERLKQQRLNHEQQIVDQRKQNDIHNNQQRLIVKNLESLGLYNQNSFKRQKHLELSMDHQNTKLKNLKEKQSNLKKLEELEQEQIIWMKKIQKTSEQKQLVDLQLSQLHKGLNTTSINKKIIKGSKGSQKSAANNHSSGSESTFFSARL